MNLLQVILDYPCHRKSIRVWIIQSNSCYKNHYTFIYILRSNIFTLNLFYYNRNQIVCYLRLLKNKHKISDKKYERANTNNLLLKEVPFRKKKTNPEENLEYMNKQ